MRLTTAALCGFAIIAQFGGAPAVAATPVPRAVADGWPDRWCQAEPKMTRDQLISVMGQPTSSSDTSLTWSAYQYQFNAFLTTGRVVKQLDINTYALSAIERAALKCASVRTKPSRQKVPDTQTTHTAATACTLVSATEMSAILGTPVLATPDERSVGETRCDYKPAGGLVPAVQFSIAWGDGRAAMLGMGLAEKREHGLTTPFDGLGDQAGSSGPALMIRTGEDLVTLVFSGVPDAPGTARKIFNSAKARM